MPFGLDNIATYWAEKRGFNLIVKKLNWAYTDYSIFNVPINTTVNYNKTIWVYWKQGLENAPFLVRKCVDSVLKNKGIYNVVFLTAQNVSEYIKFPEFINQKHQKGYISEAHYSDLLRTQLLILYGGIWIDATCYITGSLPVEVEKSSFFMFSTANWWPWVKNPSLCSNWFIKSNKDNLLLIRTRNFLFEHWRKRNRVLHYFVYHFAFSALVEKDKECGDIWNKVPFYSNINPHYLMYSFEKKFELDNYQYILSQSFIHKCTYKYDKNLLCESSENNLQHFLK